MNLYLVRHARSLGNERKETYKEMLDWQVPLTDEGREQAKNVGIELGGISNPIIISSPYVRALDTARIISKQFKYITPAIIQLPLIREREWACLRDEYESFETREERNHLFDFYRRPVNGESFADCYQRAFIFLEYLKNKFKNIEYDPWNNYDNVIIVSHGEFLKLLLMIIDGNTVEEFDSLPNIKNCKIIQKTLWT